MLSVKQTKALLSDSPLLNKRSRVVQDNRQIEVIYKSADAGPEAEARLNRAFDVLFDETLKEIQAVPEVPTGERLAVQGHWPKS